MNLSQPSQPLPHVREIELAAKRLGVILRDVIEPSATGPASGLSVEAWSWTDVKSEPPSFSDAMQRAVWRAVEAGWRWGPKWSTCWFRVRGEAPAWWPAGTPLTLRFSSGTEALVWSVSHNGRELASDGAPIQGLDVNRDRVPTGVPARAGDHVEAVIEAACNHPFGVLGFEWDDTEVHRRWSSETPGVLERAELVVERPEESRLARVFAFLLGLLRELPADSSRAAGVCAALEAAAGHALRGEAAQALQRLEPVLRVAPAGSTSLCHAVGHAHLDTAWLWPLRETRRKLLRTFSNQLGILSRRPAYVFMASQAQHYAWVERQSPPMFEQIRRRVAEGRWEPQGAMWVEPDLNCISGESIVRQISHGVRYWESRFGVRGRQRIVYLPDTFGFGATLPQIMAQCGLDCFVTNKLSWNDRTVFPHTTFWWEGLDGTRVLAHQTPGHDYNATNTPKELRRGETNHKTRAVAAAGDGAGPRWLQPFGFGDGGGGPTDWSVEFAEMSGGCDGLPRVRLSSAASFVEALHADVRDAQSAGVATPVWSGELYLELHRGTLTTQAWLKAANRRAEDGLRTAEWLAVLAGRRGPDATLHAAWELVLLNQFHDILPGSSIGWVYDDARAQHAEVVRTIGAAISRDAAAVAGATGGALAVFNPAAVDFSGVVSTPAGPVLVERVPALGFKVIPSPEQPPPAPSLPILVNRLGPRTAATNARVSVVLDDDAADGSFEVASLRDGVWARATLHRYDDRPMMWDAWDIDPSYRSLPRPAPKARGPWREVERSPLRVAFERELTLSDRSAATVRVSLAAGSPRADVTLRVRWHEEHQLLRLGVETALGPAAVCTHGTAFGHLTRPTRGPTAFDAARFEFPVQRWIDVSEPGRGVALLAPDKFGYSVQGDGLSTSMGVSLLRSPTHPDPEADRGEHEISLAIFPHDGDWRGADVVGEAERLACPPFVTPTDNEERERFAVRVRSEGAARALVTAVKPAEDDADEVVVRFHEAHGAAGMVRVEWGVPVSGVRAVSPLERPVAKELHHSAGVTRVALRAFEIVTLAARRA